MGMWRSGIVFGYFEVKKDARKKHFTRISVHTEIQSQADTF